MKKLKAFVLAACCTLLLTGCEPVLNVLPASSSETIPSPSFEVMDPQHPERPRYHTVKLYRADGKLLWHLRASPFGDQNSMMKLTYGSVPYGFEEVIPSAVLEPEGKYTLYVMGTATGSLRFQVNSSGRIDTSR